MSEALPGCLGDLPNICGREDLIRAALARTDRRPLSDSGVDFARIQSAFAVALHMHQPLIPAGGDDLRTAGIISNLQHMLECPNDADHHNASVFRWCYKRLAEFIPQLVRVGRRPRVMLDYSGCLLHGLVAMGAEDVLESLRALTCAPAYRPCVEWLGSAWGHPVAPSTPVQDYRLHVQAWQHHFAALFGMEALARVRGFSSAEMALPNHPDVCYEFVQTLRECGYRWVLVQEHTVEPAEQGGPIRRPHLPHRLVARNSRGQATSIIAIIKTQGSDTKLVGQMQPYYEAKGLSRIELAGQAIPPLVTQIADGENGGVMMNEFPPKYMQVMEEASGSATPPLNVTEYLDYLESLGITPEAFPAIQPTMQQRIWDRFAAGAGPAAMDELIAQLQREDQRFHMEGGSWTNNLSWVRGYQHVLGPMAAASARFAEKVASPGVCPSDPRYRRALFHLLLTQTSCFRYWGEGIWADYGRELCRRTVAILDRDF
ncbi:MAG TPA: glycosyl hydrolase family 57 [Phycisphaerae bacterium]|nr:glycosyl hydrolase family 57 [Phycisphaerae bacterium]HNU46780.1 glycosyl hydrolase family 57 [Phycisphaerae bacterium]